MDVLRVMGWMVDVRLTVEDAVMLARGCDALAERLVRREEVVEMAYVTALGAAMEALARGAVARHTARDAEYEEACERLGLE